MDTFVLLVCGMNWVRPDVPCTEESHGGVYPAVGPGWGLLELGTESRTASALWRAPGAFPNLPVFTICASVSTGSLRIALVHKQWEFCPSPRRDTPVLSQHIFIGRTKCSITRQHLKIRCRDTNLIKEKFPWSGTGDSGCWRRRQTCSAMKHSYLDKLMNPAAPPTIV